VTRHAHAAPSGRYAIVAHLASGLTSTYSERGRVDWGPKDEAERYAAQGARALLANPTGYALPHYGLYGPVALLGHADPVVRYEAVPQERWRAFVRHTRPGAPVRP
jgi:hypothetical protein